LLKFLYFLCYVKAALHYREVRHPDNILTAAGLYAGKQEPDAEEDEVQHCLSKARINPENMYKK